MLLVLVGREHLGLNILLCIGQAPTTKLLKPKMLVVLDLGNIGLIEWTPGSFGQRPIYPSKCNSTVASSKELH